MKKLAIVCLLLFSVFSSAESAFEVLPLNSPVKESTANFLIKFNQNLEIEEVTYQIKNAGKIFEKPTNYQKVILSNGPEGKILKASVVKLPPGFYQLFVKIKDKKGSEHVYKTKYKDHAMFVIDSSLEVPMPDPKKNNATIAGIDSDNDGIRDDVQIWINSNLGSLPFKLKLAFKQYARAVQVSLVTSNNKKASIIASHFGLRAQDCMYSQGNQYGVNVKDIEVNRGKIKIMYLNTKERIESELKSDENFHGQEVRSLSSEEACSY